MSDTRLAILLKERSWQRNLNHTLAEIVKDSSHSYDASNERYANGSYTA